MIKLCITHMPINNQCNIFIEHEESSLSRILFLYKPLTEDGIALLDLKEAFLLKQMLEEAIANECVTPKNK